MWWWKISVILHALVVREEKKKGAIQIIRKGLIGFVGKFSHCRGYKKGLVLISLGAPLLLCSKGRTGTK